MTGAAETISIIANHKRLTVSLSDVVYAEVFRRKIVLHLTGRDIEYYDRIKNLEAQAGKRFFRCHRSYLVNLSYADRIEESDLLLTVGELRVPVARNRKSELQFRLDNP